MTRRAGRAHRHSGPAASFSCRLHLARPAATSESRVLGIGRSPANTASMMPGTSSSCVNSRIRWLTSGSACPAFSRRHAPVRRSAPLPGRDAPVPCWPGLAVPQLVQLILRLAVLLKDLLDGRTGPFAHAVHLGLCLPGAGCGGSRFALQASQLSAAAAARGCGSESAEPGCEPVRQFPRDGPQCVVPRRETWFLPWPARPGPRAGRRTGAIGPLLVQPLMFSPQSLSLTGSTANFLDRSATSTAFPAGRPLRRAEFPASGTSPPRAGQRPLPCAVMRRGPPPRLPAPHLSRLLVELPGMGRGRPSDVGGHRHAGPLARRKRPVPARARRRQRRRGRSRRGR